MIETPRQEWTDGKLVIQPIDITHGWRMWTKYRFFLYGQQQTEGKLVNQLYGFNEGPASEARHWSLPELDMVLQDWLKEIPGESVKDLLIVESIRVLLRGAIPDGTFFDASLPRIRYQILLALSDFIVVYIQKQAPMTKEEADGLSSALSNLSF